jgi:hypothetical protein
VRWYLTRRDWWEPLRRRVYGGERLGLVASVAVQKSASFLPRVRDADF